MSPGSAWERSLLAGETPAFSGKTARNQSVVTGPEFGGKRVCRLRRSQKASFVVMTVAVTTMKPADGRGTCRSSKRPPASRRFRLGQYVLSSVNVALGLRRAESGTIASRGLLGASK